VRQTAGDAVVSDYFDAVRNRVVVFDGATGTWLQGQYHSEQTTSAIVCHHRRAKYFIDRKPREQRDAR